MPGTSFTGDPPPLTQREDETSRSLRRDIEKLAGGVGVRSFMQPKKLGDSVAWLMDELNAAGYPAIEQVWVPGETPTPNLEVTVPGTTRAGEIIVVGAHYDSFYQTPGADDNASGVAATLELARRFATNPKPRTIRFLFFVNEEPPHFQQETMGSLVYARRCRERRENIRAMLSLEAIGYFDNTAGSQQYPPPFSWFYPDRGNFVAFVGDLGSRPLLHESLASFRSHASVPSEGVAAPASIAGVGWSDHWSFWQAGYQAVMVTGTATFRNPHYHKPTDTADRLDYATLSRTISALERTITNLATSN